jgi:hypothetical protein
MTLVTRIAAGQDGVVTLGQALHVGVSPGEVRCMIKAGRWRRLARAAYLVEAAVDAPDTRRAKIRAAVASFGPEAVAALGTAAELHGIAGLRRTEEIHVSLPGPLARARRHGEPDVVVHQLSRGPGAITWRYGIPVTTPLATTVDVILQADRFAAVSVLDSALNRRLIDDADFARIPALIRGRRGAVGARRLLGEVDGRAQSPLETRTRLRCVDGKVPPDVVQVDVRDRDGYLLGMGDLGWRAARVVAEADGAGPHGTPDALFEDRQRQNRFMNAGWIVLRFTWADTLRPDYIPYVVREALQSRPH